MADYSWIWLVFLLPALGALVQAFLGGMAVKALGPTLGKKVMGGIATLFIAIPFALAVLITQKLAGEGHEKSHIVTLFDWIKLQNLHIPFEALVDPLSMTMVLIITGIGALIHLYATGYMFEDREYTRFFTYLNLFVAAMLCLVLGNNLAMMFIGWEGVGLCSYLLIGFWYKDLNNAKAANKAFIVNRIGDWGLTLGIFIIGALMAARGPDLLEGRYLSYDSIAKFGFAIFGAEPGWTTAAALLLFVGACGKSAQFPLYLWLPDAMAGPTPVSALIHAATMVTAGVFLLNRMNLVFQFSPVASAVVAAVGAFTALFAALIAFGQTDIKKVLAYSTVSQLGFMFLGCGVGAYWVGLFHVVTHAFFKALLFLGSGAVIYAMAHEQDMRRYGNLRKYLPITFTCMIIGYVAIAGISIPGVFGFAGYYSKELILGAALANGQAEWEGINVGLFAGALSLLTAALTAAYMTRMTWMTFFGKEERWREMEPAHDHEHEDHGHHAHRAAHDHGPDTHGFFYNEEEVEKRLADAQEHHHHLDRDHTPKEVPPSMWITLVALAIPSIVAGYFLEKNHLLKHWLQPGALQVVGEPRLHPEAIDVVQVSAIAAFGGVLLALGYYVFKNKSRLPLSEGWDMSKWSWFLRSSNKQFGYDEFMVRATTEGGGILAEGVWKRFDVGVIDFLVNAVGVAAQKVGAVFRTIQTGYARTYALVMLIGTALVLAAFVQKANQVGFPNAADKPMKEIKR